MLIKITLKTILMINLQVVLKMNLKMIQQIQKKFNEVNILARSIKKNGIKFLSSSKKSLKNYNNENI